VLHALDRWGRPSVLEFWG